MTYIDVVASFNVSKSSKPSEDAFAFDLSRGLAAISDGVSNSFFSSIWSKLLVEQFCQTEDQDLNDLFVLKDVNNWLRPIQGLWLREVKYLLDHNDFDPEISNQLPQKKPAAATFIGVQFISGPTGVRWRALIIGDSILIHMRNKKLVQSCLINKTEQFRQHTQSLGSYLGTSKPLALIEGEHLPGDQFILATDAIGKWLLQFHEINEQAFSTAIDMLIKMQEPKQIENLVNELRQNDKHRLDWDDTCILMINPDPAGIPVPLSLETEPSFATSEPTPIQQISESVPVTQNRLRWALQVGIFVIAVGVTIFIGYGFWHNWAWHENMSTKTPNFPIVTTITPDQAGQGLATVTITVTNTPTMSKTPTISSTPIITESITPTISRTLTITATYVPTLVPPTPKESFPPSLNSASQ